MLSAVSKTAARTSRRRLIASGGTSTTVSITAAAQQFSSSAFAYPPPIPESIREAVKSSVLDEATRPDSKLWTEGSQQRRKRINGSAARTPVSSTVGLTPRPHSHVANGETASDIDEPISPARLEMLHDPLDEWHLDALPKRPIHALPPSVRPLSDGADPFSLSKNDMKSLSESIRRDLIGSDHPVLTRAASYFFEEGQDGGKKVRPMMVLLLSRAMALGLHPSASDGSGTRRPESWQRQDLPSAQRRLAEISEMIHTASLFHDDVIDGANTRRGAPAVHRVFGDKMAILAGDYLLARASISLARLRDVEVVETMSTIIEHLVRGEVMQMRGNSSNTVEGLNCDVSMAMERMVYYLRKNYYKTGSLMANSCKSAAILGGYDDSIVSAAYRYGKHLGIAFQLVDDVLDFEGSALSLGKPALADLNAGLATAPVLFAAELHSEELWPLIDRKFQEEGDVDTAVDLVGRSDGIERTKVLAHVHAELAIDAILELDPSAYRDSLVHLAYKVVDRSR